LNDLEAHLREKGWNRPLELAASNETPLRPLASMFTEEITTAIGDVYREDFERFPYSNVEPERLERSGAYDESVLRAIGRVAERGERIGDLALRAQRVLGANKVYRDEIELLRRRIAQLDASASRHDGVARKVRRRMFRALNRA
jgi:hypothetical protein